MRLYIPVTADELRQWRDGETVSKEGYLAQSEDESDELAALESAADDGQAVAVAVVDGPESAIEAGDLVALHLDADSSGHLAWYDPTELETVLSLLRGS